MQQTTFDGRLYIREVSGQKTGRWLMELPAVHDPVQCIDPMPPPRKRGLETHTHSSLLSLLTQYLYQVEE